MVGAQIDIVQQAAEAGSWPHLSVVSLSKIDDTSDVARHRERLRGVKWHYKSHWNSFVTQIVGHLHRGVSTERMTDEDNWVLLFSPAVRYGSLGYFLPVRMTM
jgi:hypothetical protein